MNRFSLLFCLFTCLLADSEAALDAEGIVGGEEASPDEYNYQISLQANGQSFCGGSIIGDQHVLTAAHCVTDKHKAFTTFRKQVVAGALDLDRKGINSVAVDVEKIYIPKEYGLSSTNLGDIAVLKLKKPLGLSSNKHLSKLELPEADETYAGEEATITGYGWTWVNVHKNAFTGDAVENGGSGTSTMKFAITDVLTTAECQRNYRQRISDKHICARVQQRYRGKTEGVCSGDSGGPLVYNDNVVIGTVSTSPIGCNESVAAAIYTRVSAYLGFIKNAMADRVSSSTMRVYEYASLARPTRRPFHSLYWSNING